MRAVDQRVDLLQKSHRFPVLVATFGIGQPFSGLARIIEVEHRGDRIDAQPVNMELLHPVERVGGQYIGNLAAAKIVDRRIPVRVEAAARVGVLIQRRAIKLGKSMRINREMRGHPVNNNADARLVRHIDEMREAFRRSKAA